MLSFIVAVAHNNAIGRGNTMPWYLPADLRFFKNTTLGKPVIMGRKTYESLGKPLPGRLNIVLSTSDDIVLPEGVALCRTMEQAIALAKEHSTADEICIIGGGSIYRQYLHLVDRIYLTRIDMEVPDADTFFPAMAAEDWTLVQEDCHRPDEKNKYPYCFCIYDRK